MRATLTRSLMCLIGLALLPGCPGFGGEEPKGVLDEVPEFPSFENEITLLMQTHCLECHSDNARLGAPPTFRLDIYEDAGGKQGIKSRADLCIVRINNAGNPMPPSNRPQMNQIEKDTMARWSECGKPESLDDAKESCPPLDDVEPEPDPNPDAPVALNFAESVEPIVSAKCNFGGCHAAENPQGGISFVSLDLMQEAANPASFVPCDAENSNFIKRIKLEAGNGLLMPLGGPPLDAADIELLERWVNEGDDVKPLCMEAGLCGNFEVCRSQCEDPNSISCFVQCSEGNAECAACVGPAMSSCGREFCDDEAFSAALTCFEDCLPSANPLQCVDEDCADEFQDIEDCMNPIIRNRNCNEDLEACDVRVMIE